MKQRIFALVMALAVLSALSVPVRADSITVPLDPATGQPIGSSDPSGSTDTVVISDTCVYDTKEKRYLYTLGRNQYSSNIPEGAVISEGESVSISLPSGLSGVLYRDSELIPEADLTNITETGFYVLQLTGTGLHSSAQFSFAILGKLTNRLNDLTLPEGFRFVYVMQDGTELDHAYSNYYQFLEDGAYQICWGNDAVSQQYLMKFTLDREAPTLLLPGVENGQAHCAVSLEDLEAGCYIIVEHNGQTKTLKGNSHVLTDAGDYVLTVCDAAGNYTRYAFTIHVYLNFSAVAAIVMLLMVIAGVLLYCRWVRRHARVG